MQLTDTNSKYMQNEQTKFIPRTQMQSILDNAPQGVDKKALIDKFVTDGFTVEGVNDQKPEPNFLDKVGSDISKRYGNIKSELTSNNVTSPVNLQASAMEKGLRVAGQVAGGVGDVLGSAIGSTASTVNDLTGGALGETAKSAGSSILQTELGKKGLELAQQGMEEYSKFKQEYPNAAKDLEAVVNIASIIPVGKIVGSLGTGAKILTEEAIQAGKAGVKVAKQAPEALSTISKNIQDIGRTPKTIGQVVGDVAQGTTEDIKPVATALKTIDTKKVKTYSDLLGEINKTIPQLAAKQDAEFLKDSTLYTLNDLAVKQATKSGKEISTDYVTKGLNELKDFYTSVGDDVSKADIEELITKANTEGLTRKEVNDIARLHGRELNAYNANGQLSSGLTKQAAENTRQGLKNTARQGFENTETKNIDNQLSALYDTQKLIEKNVEAVNKLQQRIQERGLVEKLGHGTFKALDVISGGLIRGVVGGLLPRGVGYKTMNAIDIENALRGNLDILEKSLKTESDEELIKILNSYSKDVLSNSSLTKKMTKNTNTIPNINNISSDISQSTKKASGKLGGFAQFLKETPEGKLKGKMVPEDADAVVDFADVVENPSSVSDKTYLQMRKEIKGIAKAYNVKGKTDRELVDSLLKKIYNDYHKFPGFSELGLLPKLAIGTALTAGAIKAGVELNKK